VSSVDKDILTGDAGETLDPLAHLGSKLATYERQIHRHYRKRGIPVLKHECLSKQRVVNSIC
jgi:hypothetical protein